MDEDEIFKAWKVAWAKQGVYVSRNEEELKALAAVCLAQIWDIGKWLLKNSSQATYNQFYQEFIEGKLDDTS